MVFWSVTKYGEIYPRSNFMPSTTCRATGAHPRVASAHRLGTTSRPPARQQQAPPQLRGARSAAVRPTLQLSRAAAPSARRPGSASPSELAVAWLRHSRTAMRHASPCRTLTVPPPYLELVVQRLAVVDRDHALLAHLHRNVAQQSPSDAPRAARPRPRPALLTRPGQERPTTGRTLTSRPDVAVPFHRPLYFSCPPLPSLPLPRRGRHGLPRPRPHLLHGLRDEVADLALAVGGDGAHLSSASRTHATRVWVRAPTRASHAA
jgi:hypothetical protein